MRRILTPEIFSFLTVGGAGYVVDVAAFNVFRAHAPTAGLDPSVSKILAVCAAMVVTYIGNRVFTWRGQSTRGRRREIALFVVFNAIGLGFSVVTLMISHDLLNLTSRLSDNISANVIGLALGTAFRYWTYKRFVFAVDAEPLRYEPSSSRPRRSAHRRPRRLGPPDPARPGPNRSA